MIDEEERSVEFEPMCKHRIHPPMVCGFCRAEERPGNRVVTLEPADAVANRVWRARSWSVGLSFPEVVRLIHMVQLTTLTAALEADDLTNDVKT